MSEDLFQCMRPHGEAGLKTIEDMNAEHTPQIMCGVDNLPPMDPKIVLDVGCGGGIFTKIILERYPGSKVCGIDISDLCIDYAKDFLSGSVEAGRASFQVADVHSLPFDNDTFDLVVSNASHFFWSDIEKGMGEICRVMKKGGVVCLTAGIRFKEEPTEAQKKELEGLTNMLTDNELMDLMSECGFDTEIYSDDENGFCAYIGMKRK